MTALPPLLAPHGNGKPDEVRATPLELHASHIAYMELWYTPEACLDACLPYIEAAQRILRSLDGPNSFAAEQGIPVLEALDVWRMALVVRQGALE